MARNGLPAMRTVGAQFTRAQPYRSAWRGTRKRIFGHHSCPCRVADTFSVHLYHQILPVRTEWLYYCSNLTINQTQYDYENTTRMDGPCGAVAGGGTCVVHQGGDSPRGECTRARNCRCGKVGFGARGAAAEQVRPRGAAIRELREDDHVRHRGLYTPQLRPLGR